MWKAWRASRGKLKGSRRWCRFMSLRHGWTSRKDTAASPTSSPQHSSCRSPNAFSACSHISFSSGLGTSRDGRVGSAVTRPVRWLSNRRSSVDAAPPPAARRVYGTASRSARKAAPDQGNRSDVVHLARRLGLGYPAPGGLAAERAEVDPLEGGPDALGEAGPEKGRARGRHSR